jgi:hypothetical protein
MILMASNLNRIAFQTFAYSAQVIEEVRFDGFIDQVFAMFGAEDDVGINFGQGLWHGCDMLGLRSFPLVGGPLRGGAIDVGYVFT